MADTAGAEATDREALRNRTSGERLCLAFDLRRFALAVFEHRGHGRRDAMQPEEIIRHAAAALMACGVPYMVVGSVASIAYGEPRTTRDLNLVVALKPEQIADLAAHFPEPDWFLDQEAAREAVSAGGQFNILYVAGGLKLDLMPHGPSDYDAVEFARRQPVEVLPGLLIDVARPEDVILGKLRYYREGRSTKHLDDIAGILAVSGEQVDRAYVDKWAQRLGLNGEWARARR